MNLQQQTNQYTCLPTSFAMALDIPIGIILNYFGHDGSELLDEYQHRGFHPSEMIYYAYKKGYYVIPFETEPELVNENGKVFSINQHFIDYRGEVIRIMDNNIGVLTGRTKLGKLHAVCWHKKIIYDPNFSIYTLKNKDGTYNFIIETFYMIGKI